MARFCIVVFICSLAACYSGTTTSGQEHPHATVENLESKVMRDGKVWLTENLNIAVSDSYCPQDDTLNCNRYGRLYTWKAAREGCELLGSGWRLPTDKEWRALAASYGGIVNDSDDRGNSAYENLLESGQAGFNATLGGNREENGTYERLGAHGFYWTSTEYDSTEAWFYNFGKGSGLLNRHTGSKERAISVRCVKDEQP